MLGYKDYGELAENLTFWWVKPRFYVVMFVALLGSLPTQHCGLYEFFTMAMQLLWLSIELFTSLWAFDFVVEALFRAFSS